MKSFLIEEVSAAQVYDSRGKPTVEVVVKLANGLEASAIAPSGASVGSAEAVEIREMNANGVGNVFKAVDNVNKKISKYVSGMDCRFQSEIDNVMLQLDGTKNKSVLGANAILPVSLAVAKAASMASDIPLFTYLGGVYADTLPVPMMNFINGGVHADNLLDIQEFMIMPVGVSSFSEGIIMASDILKVLKDFLKSKHLSTGIGDEGGFAVDVSSSENALELLMIAIEKAGYVPGEDVLIALDIAASELYQDGVYSFKGEGEKMKQERLISYYKNIVINYPIFSIEDPASEYDSESFAKITSTLGECLQIVGDDVFATNAKLLKKGHQEGIANAIIIKPNQVGTLTETIETVKLAKTLGYSPIISHRSGETEDTTIASLAVGLAADQIKAGCLARTDRVAKYNELLRIESRLGSSAKYAGAKILEKYKQFRSKIKRNDGQS